MVTQIRNTLNKKGYFPSEIYKC